MPSAVRKGKPRSSRFSSPKTRNAAPTRAQAPTASSQWTEPALKDGKPSYEEHGGSPYGVLEDMQPLGQPPAAKVKSRVKAEPLRKSLGRSLGAQQENGRPVEESPSIDTPRATSVVPEKPVPAIEPVKDDNMDSDFNPRASRRSARSRRTRGGSAASEMNKAPSPPLQTAPLAAARDSPPLEMDALSTMNEISQSDIERVNFRTVVDIADRRAQALGFHSFGGALRQVQSESQSNERYAHLLRAVLLQSATDKEKAEFTSAIRRAKRTLRKAADAVEIADDLEPHELNGTRGRSGSRSRSSRPELIARPSIEEAAKVPKIRLSMRKTPKDATVKIEDMAERRGTRSQRRQRARTHSTTSSLSVPSSPSMAPSSEMEMIIPAARADAARLLGRPEGFSAESTPITAAGSGRHTVNGSDGVQQVELRSNSVNDTNGSDGMNGLAGSHSTPVVLSGSELHIANGSDEGDQVRSRSRSTTLFSITSEDRWDGCFEENYGISRESRKAGLSMKDFMDKSGARTDEGHAVPESSRPSGSLKRSPIDAGFDDQQLLAIEETKRRKLDETLYKDPGPASSYRQSHLRESVESGHISKSRDAPNHRPTIRLSNGTANNRFRRGREQSDSPLSDMSSTPPPVEDAFADMQATRTTKKAKTKQSPRKKHGGSAGGVDERNGRMGSVGGLDTADESEHNDYCDACGGAGELLCCDGCQNAYHFTCVDPPLDPDSPALKQAWYCPSCAARRKPPTRQPRGLFASLFQGLEKRNPTIFSLPDSLRAFYTGVHTGKDGKFEDSANVKTRTSRAGYDEPMDTLKMKDNKGNSILCYACARSAAGKRELITCDVCGNHWHLDCTNPPLANPPFRDQHNRKTKDWMCPLHVEHDLSAIDPIRLSQRRRVHLRRPKVAKTVDTSLRRGLINNGVIDIINDSSSDEDDEFEEDETASGTVFRVPAKGVKLDFIDKVHRTRAVETALSSIPPRKSTRMNSQVLQAKLDSRPVLERHLVLSLVQLGSEQKDIHLSGDAIQDLINTMTAEAPLEVILRVAEDEDETMANGLTSPPASTSGGNLTDEQRKQLEALQELITRKLGNAGIGSGSRNGGE